MERSVEVWKNTAAGARWVKGSDRTGREISKVVPGGKTFTLSTFERQLNQDSVVDATRDMFRNGTFLLVRSSDETIESEILSPNALTDSEIERVVYEVLAGTLDMADAIADVDSTVTLHRIWEAAVLEELPAKDVKAVKRKLDSYKKASVPEREIVSGREVVVTVPDVPEGE